MGEIAEMMLDGTLDCETGEYLGDPCGYPRTAAQVRSDEWHGPTRSQKRNARRKRAKGRNSPNTEVKPVSLWADDRGFLHASEVSADAANANFEREERRRVVHRMLLQHIAQQAPPSLWASPSDRIRLADWLIENWPAIRAIGFAYRVHELGPAGRVAFPQSEDQS